MVRDTDRPRQHMKTIAGKSIDDLPIPKLIRNARTDEGAALGVELARMCDIVEPVARLEYPTIPPRCASCAFREGPHVANGSPSTLIAALDCVRGSHVFECHEPARLGLPCSGWLFFYFADAKNKSPESTGATPGVENET